MNLLNHKMQQIISFAMYESNTNKKQLAKRLKISYPTMLSRLKNPYEMRISEVEQLFKELNVNLNKYIKL